MSSHSIKSDLITVHCYKLDSQLLIDFSILKKSESLVLSYSSHHYSGVTGHFHGGSRLPSLQILGGGPFKMLKENLPIPNSLLLARKDVHYFCCPVFKSLQGSLDTCPMAINVNQNPGIDPKYLPIPVIDDYFFSMLIGILAAPAIHSSLICIDRH